MRLSEVKLRSNGHQGERAPTHPRGPRDFLTNCCATGQTTPFCRPKTTPGREHLCADEISLKPLARASPRSLRRGGHGAERAKTLVFVGVADLSILDPVVTGARPTRNAAYLVFDTLYGIDTQWKAQPQMVEAHAVEEDGLTWTLKLRDGLRFHDNEPVLARDVVASIRRFAPRVIFANAPPIGIGGHLAVPPLPHHRAYGSRTRRFDGVQLGHRHEVGARAVLWGAGFAAMV